MTGDTPAELQRLVAAEFDRQRWEYDLSIGQNLIAEIEQSGEINARRFVRRLPTEFFYRNGTSRENVAAAIERAVGGRRTRRVNDSTMVVFTDNRRYEVKLGPGAQINNSPVNIGNGTQISVNVDASKGDVLRAVEAIIRAALDGAWNPEAARDLASVIDSREDIDVDDIRKITTEVVKSQRPRRGRVKELLGKIAASGLGGALGTGISTGLGELFSQLPL